MRIVGGDLRGRPLRTPSGGDTRPTSDRARQAIFNVLEHAPWSPGIEGLRVADLFAGSGAMGLEALSRGAASCLFIEQEPAAAGAIDENIQAFGLADRARLLRRDATQLVRRPARETLLDLLFLDPPYGKGLAAHGLAALSDGAWLAPAAVAVLEQGPGDPRPVVRGFSAVDERRYGVATVLFLMRN